MSGVSADRDRIESLFRPGDGAIPPLLAGREAELAVLDRFRRDLLGARHVPSNVIVYGPRGNGKTVILDSFRSACASDGIPAERFILAPAATLGTLDAARSELLPPLGKLGSLPRRLKTAKSFGLLSFRVALGALKETTILEVLRARLADGPLVVAIDEAHTLPAEVGHQLLNASQRLRAEGLPFLLLLAGTPDIESKLSAIGASFWERSRRIRVGRLSLADARKALVEPLEGLGVQFEPKAIETAMRDIVRYPYFTQLWGESLVERKRDFDSQPIVSVADATEASALFVRKRTDFYAIRREELRIRGILPAAEAVARAWRDGVLKKRDNLSEVVGAALADAKGSRSGATASETEDVAEQLVKLGFVWRVGTRLESGIPSLMDHVVEQSERTPSVG